MQEQRKTTSHRRFMVLDKEIGVRESNVGIFIWSS